MGQIPLGGTATGTGLNTHPEFAAKVREKLSADTGLDISEALAVPGVYAVLTHEDVPGSKYYGLDHADQPVLAIDEVRYQGEPVAILAAVSSESRVDLPAPAGPSTPTTGPPTEK